MPTRGSPSLRRVRINVIDIRAKGPEECNSGLILDQPLLL